MANKIFRLAILRLFLMLRQKMGWMSLLVGTVVVCISMVAADVSYLSSGKIFLDFALATSFIIQTFLALYFGSNIFEDEKNRRTLHLILSGGVTRLEWILGNVLGIWIALLAMDAIWFSVTAITGILQFQMDQFGILLQVKLLQGFECLILISLTMLFSFFVKPILALALGFSVSMFAHSVNQIQAIFTDPVSGRFVESSVFSVVYWASKIMPPLEWFDIKSLVGYEAPLAWSIALGLVGVALLWSAILLTASWLRFDRMDV